MEALLFILHTLITLLVVAFLLRVLMPLVRADFRNQLGEAVLKVTDPLVVPLRRLLPPAKRIDVGALAALLIVHFAGTVVLRLVAGATLNPAVLVTAGFLSLLHTVIQFYFIVVLLYALLSWFAAAGYNPLQDTLARLCEPLLAPVRRVIPPLGGLDLSVLFVLIALQALQILLR
jgi:YggT family protein